MTKPRDYAYDTAYEASPVQVHNRVLRNKARREAERANGKKKIPKNVDVDHKKPLSEGGTNAKGNTRLISTHRNRGFKRTAKNRPVGEA